MKLLHISNKKKAKQWTCIYVRNKRVKKLGMQTTELVLYLYFNVLVVLESSNSKKGYKQQTTASGFKPINCHVATKPP